MEISLEQYNKMAERLTELEYLLAERRWIPVSERLPEKYGDYLVSTSNGWVVTDYYASYGWDDNSDKDYVVAWMPLPEPYKGGDTE